MILISFLGRQRPGRWLAWTLCGACASVDGAARRVDQDAGSLLEAERAATLAGRRERTLLPEPALEEPAAAPAEPPAPGAEPAASSHVLVLTLPDALRAAYLTNRGFIARKESLFLTAVGLTGTRYSFEPQFTGSLGTRFAGGDGQAETASGDLQLGVDQNLPFGGNWSLSATSSATDSGARGPGSPWQFQSGVNASFNLPLLRGAGSAIAREALTQAERSMVYAIREFEQFREDFSIDVARRFYSLVESRQNIDNQQRNMESVEFARRQAEALFEVGRTNELDVLRARRSELQSRDALIAAQESHQLALDQFKVFLGLDPATPLDIHADVPGFVPVDWDVESAVEVALVNRLDWLNVREQLEDSARGLRIAENGLLPDLDLNLSYGRASAADATFPGQDFDQGTYSVGLTLELPFERLTQRNALRATQISHAQQVRALEEFRHNLEIEIRSSFRELDRRRKSLDIQSRIIADQEKNLIIARIRFQRGEISNRDLVEAQQALLEAENSLVNEQVNYEIARLNLRRDLGILFLDDQGLWEE